MGTTYCPRPSVILATSLLTALSLISITRSEGASDFSAMTRLQNSPKMHIKIVAFESQRHSTHSYREVLLDKITETVWSSSNTGLKRHKRETSDAEATDETQRNPQSITNVITSTSVPPTTSSTDASTSADDSTFDNMYLCDHPPKTFSPSFHGSSWETCLQYDRKRVISFRDTLILCNSIYSLTETNPEAFNIGVYQSDVGPLKVITHQGYVRVCQPLFRRFNKCEERDFLTICWEDRVVFFHSSTCSHSSNEIFVAMFLLDNNTNCFHEFCEGRQNVVDAEMGGLLYRLTNTPHSLNAPSCGYDTMSLKHIYREYNGTLYVIINDHWPCCYALYAVIWAGLPEAHGLNGAWSYLPAACQAGEVLLLVLVGCVMVGSVGGNLLVMVVMLRGGHRGQESSLLRTSLAFADLLTAAFVIVPSFVQHLSPLLLPPTYFMVTPDMALTSNPVNATSKIQVLKSNNIQTGFTVFQSVLFHTTTTTSLLMMLVLSVERFVITGRYLRYKDYFSYRRTVLAIAASWTTSLINALWFAAHDDGGLAAQWLNFEKLPVGSSGSGPGGVRNVIYHGQLTLLFILGISVVTFSVVAMRNFVREQLHVAKEWRSLKMKASKQYSQDNRYVLTTMMMMLVLFLTSTIPLVTNILFNSISYTFHHHPLFSYLAWWLFMAASAWNPWVYNFRSRQFKDDLTHFQRQVLQAWRWQRFRGEEAQPVPPKSLPFETSSLPAESKTE